MMPTVLDTHDILASWNPSGPLGIWVDDIRLPPTCFTLWVQDHYEALPAYLVQHAARLERISFDHDLGANCTGLDLMNDMERLIRLEGIQFPRLRVCSVHTANGAARTSMLQAAASIIAHAGCPPDAVSGRFPGDDWVHAHAVLHGGQDIRAQVPPIACWGDPSAHLRGH